MVVKFFLRSAIPTLSPTLSLEIQRHNRVGGVGGGVRVEAQAAASSTAVAGSVVLGWVAEDSVVNSVPILQIEAMGRSKPVDDSDV